MLGSGPNRIGQGIEFDYCCVHAAETARELGYAAVMVNCNPETVSTDHGVSDRLYLEPVTIDAVLDICAAEQPLGVIAQLGGQTPLRLARALAEAGVPILGTAATTRSTSPRTAGASARCSTSSACRPRPGRSPRDRRRGCSRPPTRWATRCWCGPRYVLGGRAMAICDSPDALRAYIARERPEGVLLVDRFLENAIELDVDALSDGTRLLDRRGDGARRGGRRPLGRLGLRAARPERRAGPGGRARGADRRPRRGASARSAC